ncbi:sigma-54-dependent transcriptional regulator [Sphingomonas pokkalii]|uniref:Fis family transcriptional regulator n=1 Tax=Sphingomonas pokkalii TaxID=2175090 RepID=A0A2U0SBV4_9SPHN|nr:response regulator [Sphingomonas pokkalii]PVX28857.1 Fis family transcriptional regulator [Sphingomonas pokkalii]
MSSAWNVLLVEDDSTVARATEILFRLAGHRLTIAADPTAAYSLLARHRYDVILLDMNFVPGMSSGEEGLACIARIMADDADARVIVITAHSGIRIAVAAMQAGARDFLMKPWRKDDLFAKCAAVIAQTSEGGGSRRDAPRPTASTILGDSAGIEQVRALVRRVGPTAASVCVTGPSGSGRTLVANAIHAASADAAVKAVRIDLRDSEQWQALNAESGTVILRYPDQLAPVAQARLADRLLPGLRCIGIADDVATLSPALRRRLATVEIAIPPLAQRRGDAVILARHFALAAGEAYGRGPVRLSPAAEAMVIVSDWPDEVRGLAAAIERAALLSNDGMIDAAAIRPISSNTGPAPTPALSLNDAERLMIEAALKEHRYNVSRAASALGISRGTLYRRMAQHGL